MKIRTITFFTDSSFEQIEGIFKRVSSLKSKACDVFSPLEIQTVRIALDGSMSDIENAGHINKLGEKYGVPFISLGMYDKDTPSERLTEIIDRYENLSLSYNCRSNIEVQECSKIISALASQNPMNNFRFAASMNIKPFTPFFPAAYAGAGLSFALGFEWADLLYEVISKITDMNHLKTVLEKTFASIEKNCLAFEEQTDIHYRGLDTSLNPSVEETGSVAYSYDKVIGSFGSSGTLALTKGITDILSNIPVRRTGYCGVMFPVLEDRGLAHYWSERNINIDKLLLYSSVCGCGLDMIPLPGDITPEHIDKIILDLKAISDRYNKPLSARLLPVSGKSKNHRTDFHSPYLVNAAI